MGKLISSASSEMFEKKTYKDNKYNNHMNHMNYMNHMNGDIYKTITNNSTIANNSTISSIPKDTDEVSCDFSALINNEKYEKEISEFFASFYDSEKNSKRGLFIYGKSGVGKTHLIKTYLKKHNYDPIFYEPYEQRNKNSLQLDNISNTRVNVLNMFKKEERKIVIVIDEIENMNNGDKTGITSLIKSLKIKKNKKKDVKNVNPIICISSTNSEKKIKELMDVCKVINIEPQKNSAIENIFLQKIGFSHDKLVGIVSGNLHKMEIILKYFFHIYESNQNNQNVLSFRRKVLIKKN